MSENITVQGAEALAFLLTQFYAPNQLGQTVQKAFPLEEVPEACSIIKKLREVSDEMEVGGGQKGFKFRPDGVAHFSAAEAALLVKLVKEVQILKPDDYETVSSVRLALGIDKKK